MIVLALATPTASGVVVSVEMVDAVAAVVLVSSERETVCRAKQEFRVREPGR